MLNKEKLHEFFRFIIVGVISTIIHYGVYLLSLKFTNTSYAYSVGYICSFALNFYLSLSLTFKVKGSVRKILGFALSHLINYSLHIILLQTFISLSLKQEYAPIPVFAIAVPVNFLLVRFVFTSKYFS